MNIFIYFESMDGIPATDGEWKRDGRSRCRTENIEMQIACPFSYQYYKTFSLHNRYSCTDEHWMFDWVARN